MPSPALPVFLRLVFALLLLALHCLACGEELGDAGERQSVDRSQYPSGPFGTRIDTVIENFTLTTVDGDPLSLQDLRSDPAARVLYINTAAGWCAACREEQPALNQLVTDFGDRGLVILVALFQDNESRPATAATVRQWTERYQSQYLVVPDPTETFSAFYDPALTPLNLVVDLDTMLIAYQSTGTDVQNLRRQFDILLR
jgi:thiol-disulfide isomerase/thioredoxin